ncbi:CBS domain-containing protein [Evansella sp. AB-rgal1]|uniref:CBS domain-containing protein n=1 Tax=Evansella sp. AB-rgal1 TaxID=3242696 RepID=UPI00359DA13B
MHSMIGQSDRVARFEAAFNRIHNKLRELTIGSTDHISYSEALYKSRNRHNVVRQHYDILKQFGHLRNALVHQRFNKDHYIADPHEDTVKEIERVEGLLMKPPLALSIASQPVTCFKPDIPVTYILKELEKTGFSQFPIYDDESAFVGLLTEGGIAKWISMNMHGDVVSLEGIQAKDILSCEKKHNVQFLHRGSTIYDLEDVFEGAFDRNEKLEAILITQTGIRTQKPIGIVTSWDLVRIDHTTLTLASQF